MTFISIYNSHGKYKPKLNKYFHMYRCQLNFSLFSVTSAFGISCQHLDHPNLLLRSGYRLHVSFHVRLILHEGKVKNAYIESACCSISDVYGLDPDETWIYVEWFYTTDCGSFGHEIKATERPPPDDLTR